MKRNRFDNAVLIQEGASNMRAIANELCAAIDECDKASAYRKEDPAIRLILHQLCHLAMMSVAETHPAPYPQGFDFYRDYEICMANASEATREQVASNQRAARDAREYQEGVQARHEASVRGSALLQRAFDQSGVAVVEISL